MKNTATRLLLFLTLLGSLLLSSLAPGSLARAQAAGLALILDQPDSSAFPTVSLRLNAWDDSGLPLANLGPADFSLSEDDGASFHPDIVTVDHQAALNVALVLDVSGSMTGAPLQDAKQAATRFLDRLKDGDQAALVAFNSPVDADVNKLDPTRELAFSGDRQPIFDRVDALEASGNTELYNAVAKAVRMTALLPAGHRAVLLLSDGRNEPATSGDPQAAIDLAREANIPVFVIALGDQIDEGYLRKLATDTGGLYRATPASSELARLFDETATLLKTQYQLSYTSRLAADGGRHSLVVKLQTASATSLLGPLPEAIPTATVAPSPTAVPTLVNTVSPPVPTLPAPAHVAATVPPKPAGFAWGWPLAAGIALLASLVYVAMKRRADPKPVPEVCAKCGYTMTGEAGACPVCHSTERRPLKK